VRDRVAEDDPTSTCISISEEVRMRRASVIEAVLISFIVLLAGAQSAMATGAALKIDSVQFADSNIEILGKQFDTASPEVSIDGIGTLTVHSWNNSTIVAELPPDLEGTYLLRVSTGKTNKQNAEFALNLGGTISIVCLDWYLTAGHDEHIHVEGFLQDHDGNPVIGAAVTLRNSVDTGDELREWQLKTSTTFKYAGYNHGESCPLPVARASGATGQFCCIGLGAQEPFCPSGFYESSVLSVEPPSGSNAVWDGVTPENGRVFILDR
jgi:hypothetical protein